MFLEIRHMRVVALLIIFASSITYGATLDEIYEELRLCSPELISKEASVMAAAGDIEIERAKRLPTFSLSASGTRYASETNRQEGAAVRAQAQYTLYSFGKQSANEALKKSNLLIEQLDLTAKSKSVLTDLLIKSVAIEKLMRDISVLEKIVALQQKIFARVERRAEYEFTSDTDKNVVFSKLLQNRNAIRENRLQLEILRSEVAEISCTDKLKDVSLESLPKEISDVPVRSNDFLNSELEVIEARLTAKLQEIKASEVSLYPDLDLRAEVPVGDEAKDDASIGLQFNVAYGNMGKAQSAKTESIRSEVDALARELDASSVKRLQQLTRFERQIKTLQGSTIANQALVVDSLNQKLEAKERLFKAGRVSLFELLSVYDEFLSEELKLNRIKSDLDNALVRRAESLDYIFR